MSLWEYVVVKRDFLAITLVKLSLPWKKISIKNYGFISKEFGFRLVRGTINHMK